jgi:hypothetical protein
MPVATVPVAREVRTIHRLHETIVESGRKSLKTARKIGDMLNRIKNSLPPGTWGNWFAANLRRSMTDRTASRYRVIASRWSEVADCESITEALERLANHILRVGQDAPSSRRTPPVRVVNEADDQEPEVAESPQETEAHATQEVPATQAEVDTEIEPSEEVQSTGRVRTRFQSRNRLLKKTIKQLTERGVNVQGLCLRKVSDIGDIADLIGDLTFAEVWGMISWRGYVEVPLDDVDESDEALEEETIGGRVAV